MTWLEKLQAFPSGSFDLDYGGRRYGATKSVHGGGRSLKFYAEELGGTDFVSLNVYFTRAGVQLKPCEMPAQKVQGFLREAELWSGPYSANKDSGKNK